MPRFAAMMRCFGIAPLVLWMVAIAQSSPGNPQDHLLSQKAKRMLLGRGQQAKKERLLLVRWVTSEELSTDPPPHTPVDLIAALVGHPDADTILEAHYAALAGEPVTYRARIRGHRANCLLIPQVTGEEVTGLVGWAFKVPAARQRAVEVTAPRPPIVYQLDPAYRVPEGADAQLVVDPQDPEHPYTLTYHLGLEDLNLHDLIASEVATPLSPGAAAVAPLWTPPPLQLIS